VATAISVTLPPQPGQLVAEASSGDPHQEHRVARTGTSAGGAAGWGTGRTTDDGGPATGTAATGGSTTGADGPEAAGAPHPVQKRPSATNLDPQFTQNIAASFRYSVL